MINDFRLKGLVEQNFADVINTHGLKVIEINANEVLLRGSNYTLDIIADREGATIIYFDTSELPIKGYNVLMYLLKNRRDLLLFSGSRPDAATRSEYVDKELASLSEHLRRAGGDILRGSKDWLQGYSWPALIPSANIESQMAN